MQGVLFLEGMHPQLIFHSQLPLASVGVRQRLGHFSIFPLLREGKEEERELWAGQRLRSRAGNAIQV